MSKDLLTLVRELELVRNENLKLAERNQYLEQRNNSNKQYKTLIYKIMRFMLFLTNGHNEKIAASAQYFLDENERIREANGEKPLKFSPTFKKEVATETVE